MELHIIRKNRVTQIAKLKLLFYREVGVWLVGLRKKTANVNYSMLP